MSRSILRRFVMLVVCLLVLPVTASAQEGKLLVTVNGQRITQRDLDFQWAVRRTPVDQQAAQAVQVTEDLIDNALLKQFLNKQKVEASKALIDQRMASMEILLTSGGKKLDQVLQEHGMTRATFRDIMGLPLRWRTYASQVINDSAVREYWDKHRSEFDGTEVRASQIVKRVPKAASSEDIEKAKTELSQLRERVLKKELTFADAAKQHSQSPSAADGGDLGSFPYRGKMPVSLSQAAFRLKVGEISEPFQSPFGLHLITVTEITPGDFSFEDARAEIFDLLSLELQKRLVKQLRTEAKIERR